MKYLFNYNKYRKWRIEHNYLDENALDVIEIFNNHEELDGVELDVLWKQGKIILKEWCDIYD